MPFTPTDWISGSTPGISAARLNNMESQYDEALRDGAIQSVLGMGRPIQTPPLIGPWLHDLDAYEWTTSIPDPVSQGVGEWRTWLDLDDAGPGWLTWAHGANADGANDAALSMRITVDGIDRTIAQVTGPVGRRTRLFDVATPSPIRFKKSLKLELRHHHATQSIPLRLDCTYGLRAREPNARRDALGSSDWYAYEHTTESTSALDVVNIADGAGYVMGILSAARYVAAHPINRLTIIRDGVTLCSAREMANSSTGSAAMLMGPISFTTSMRIQQSSSSASGYAQTHVWFTLT